MTSFISVRYTVSGKKGVSLIELNAAKLPVKKNLKTNPRREGIAM
jgi:hypothetical protein